MGTEVPDANIQGKIDTTYIQEGSFLRMAGKVAAEMEYSEKKGRARVGRTPSTNGSVD